MKPWQIVTLWNLKPRRQELQSANKQVDIKLPQVVGEIPDEKLKQTVAELQDENWQKVTVNS